MTEPNHIEQLLFHLDREAECLDEMVRILTAETDALLHLRQGDLVRTAGEKLALAEAHQELVCRRAARIDAVVASEVRPRNLTELRAALGADGVELEPRQRRLRELATQVGRIRSHNMALADMGRRRVDESLRALRARRNPVYGGDGRLHAEAAAQRGHGRV